MGKNLSDNKKSKKRINTWILVLYPVVLLAGLIVVFINTNPIQIATADLPPIENLNFEYVKLPESNVIELHLINAGPDPVTIAQVMVDEAYWQFTSNPGNTLDRLEKTVVTLHYPWIETEAHEIVIITTSGTTFAHEIELAVETPVPNLDQFLAYAIVGFYVGVIPVGLGLLWYPSMKNLSSKGMKFVLAITIGLLIFLLGDTILEALELAVLLPEVYQGVPLALFMALITWMAISAIGGQKSVRDRDTVSGRKYVALLIASGIGLHNLGEGLVVGAAFALGEAALGSFLVIGFILHNITEGIGIVAPILRDSLKIRWFLLMLLISGFPAVIGTLIGGFAFSPLLGVIFLGIGVGAIWQVIYEISLMLGRFAKQDNTNTLTWLNMTGIFVGIAIMYTTAFLVKF